MLYLINISTIKKKLSNIVYSLIVLPISNHSIDCILQVIVFHMKHAEDNS